ncbi:MAG TPA: hypothetical protein VF247_11150 [Candidatus Krumholzibacteria bacterium]
MADRVAEYIERVLSMLRAQAPVQPQADDPAAAASDIFSILTSREFCYLGRTKTEPYRESTVAAIEADIRRGEPVRFYYDIGAGYHASVEPGAGLVFTVGFSELCVLAQIAAFCNRVAQIHAPGARFVLVIDNLCGWLTNDIPLERTNAYCADLRALIGETGTGDRVDVLVEAEEFAQSAYEIDRARLAHDVAALDPGADDVENVSRFLGRACDAAEAAERMARYRQAGELTERMLADVVRGVRMTQRATGGTLGFRPFPGGDSRTQVGEVALAPTGKGTVRPFLLTSRNVSRYRCARLVYPELLPAKVAHVTYAEPLDTDHETK